MVPSSLGWACVVFEAMAMLAPSRAALSAMARPMPRLAPVMNRVLPASVAIPVLRVVVLVLAGPAPARQLFSPPTRVGGAELMTRGRRGSADLNGWDGSC